MTTATRPDLIDLYSALHEYEHWRLTEADYSIRTWAGEKPGLLGFVDFMHRRGVDTLDALTYEQLRPWFVNLRVAESTKATRLAQLRSYLGYCVKRGWLTQDPSLLLRAQRPAPLLRDRLDAGELLALTEAAKGPRDRVLIALATNLALRAGEIANLTIGDVNLGHSEIKVAIPKTRDTDVMPITSDLAVELERWLAHYTAACPMLTAHSRLVPSQYVEPTGRVHYRPERPVGHPYDVVKSALLAIGWQEVKGEGVHTVRRSVARLYFDMIEDEDTFDSALLATMTLLHHQRADTTLAYIGRARATMARDRILKGQPFLTKLAGTVVPLRIVGCDERVTK